jgi:hypothetical protein
MKSVLIVFVAALLLLAGCTGEGGNTNDIINPFIGGNVAVNLYLQNGAPPPTVYDGGKFPFGVNIVMENVGEADIGPGTENPYVTARLEGILPSAFGVTDADLEMDLQERVNGAHKNFDGTILGGMPANFNFPTLNYQGKLQGNDLYTIRGTICYDYSNTATTQLCMKDDIVENVQDSTLCTLTGEKVVHNSGGPIHVTNVIQNPLGPNRIQVVFKVAHVNQPNGEFYGRSDDEDCNPSVRNTNKYRLGLNVSVTDPDATVTCYRLQNSNDGDLILYGGSPADISCTIEHTGGSTQRVYTDVMTIRTFYRYGQFIEQPIVIQSVPS